MRVEGIPEPVLLLYIHHRICRRLKKKKNKEKKKPFTLAINYDEYLTFIRSQNIFNIWSPSFEDDFIFLCFFNFKSIAFSI